MADALQRRPRVPDSLAPSLGVVLAGSDEVARWERITERAREINGRLSQLSHAARSDAAVRDRQAHADAIYAGKPPPKIGEVQRLKEERERLLDERDASTAALGRARGDLLAAAREHAPEQVDQARQRATGAYEEACQAVEAAQVALDRCSAAWSEASWWRQIEGGGDPGDFRAGSPDATVRGRLREALQRLSGDQADRERRWAAAERDEQRQGEQTVRSMRQRGVTVY